MQSRMDKYNTKETSHSSRTQKNRELYEEVKNSDITDFNVNSNVAVIETNSDSIDVNKLSKILDKRYSDYSQKRKSISIPDDISDIREVENFANTKEYDINAILEKAKQGKTADYNKERHNKVRDAQYEILNNLDLELKKVEEAKIVNKRKDEEENLMSLINTITQLELKNKEYEKQKEASQSLSILSDLSDEEPEEIDEDDKTLPQQEIPENYTKSVEKVSIIPEEVEEQRIRPITEEELTGKIEKINEDTEKDRHIEETLSKLDISMSGYEDFSDVSKNDKGTLIIKLVIFVVIIALVFGAAYILNNILDLGLF